ncbi:hypothetical protein TCAL_10524 [Tigriopus californicus]|uniref:G-protein coupled receptors family 1 profile domain-containing protein n=1 Tax=Tigriopus californicus TaxID=6832 RepID=A0A553PI30_TIGCA|nr:G-protein coupled receptor daf-37-like [Tigriopus californicus]TRY77341.1 hypothetical protein TCAL_10524 [Tigriopus californicus]|eukprot:TCALIF_10524-PA protein Name:"Similar to FR FMRFamide receptor (Drosophila melanogaster)" AED:0.18 eAED:0.21 QI:0/-1/0/1/-1/1/1/0/595
MTSSEGLKETFMSDPDCPIINSATQHNLNQMVFWLEGVAQTGLAILGITFNIIFALILSKKELRNSFNILLIVLSTFDTTYLITAFCESLRKSFKLATNLHIELFPYLLYPMQGIALTGSIFMTVAIAFERYVAVHNPINYNRAMNDARATRARVFRFVFPVIVASVLFSVPKFFESTVVHKYNPSTNETIAMLNYTAFRVHPTYARYVNWSKLLVQGVLPVTLLIFFNKKIYCDVKERQQRWRPIVQAYTPTILSDDSESHLNASTSSHRRKRPTYATSVSTPLLENGGQATSNLLQRPPGLCSSQHELAVPSLNRSPSPSSIRPSSVVDRNAKRRRVEDRLAILFMGIVAVFFICNLPRIFLHMYETSVMEKALECSRLRQRSFPAWVWVMTSVSHLFLVINSSVNLLIYCLWNAQFRKVAKTMLINLCLLKNRLGQSRGYNTNNNTQALNVSLGDGGDEPRSRNCQNSEHKLFSGQKYLSVQSSGQCYSRELGDFQASPLECRRVPSNDLDSPRSVASSVIMIERHELTFSQTEQERASSSSPQVPGNSYSIPVGIMNIAKICIDIQSTKKPRRSSSERRSPSSVHIRETRI